MKNPHELTWDELVDPPEGRETLIQLIERYQLVAELFDDDDKAIREWLRRPCKVLGGLTPMRARLADVRDVVGRLGHGIVT
jgi:uncharacterized protein (DUF2384 family)